MMFELYATGRYSLFTLRKSLIDDGLDNYFKSKNLPKQTIARILQSPVYYGMIPFHGKLYKGTHQPIISKSLYDDVQEILTGRPTSKGSKRKSFVYQGLMVCGNCGCSITAEMKKGKYIYYHCTNYKGNCSRKSVNENYLDNPFAEMFKDFLMDDEKLQWLKEGLIEAHVSEKQFREEAILSLENELRVVRERIDKLYIDKIDGKITEDFWQRNNDNWLKRQHELTHAIELQNRASEDSIKAGIALLDKAQSLYEEFKAMKNIEKKRNILKTVVSNCVLNGSNLDVEYNTPFSIFAEMSKSEDWRDVVNSIRKAIQEETEPIFVPDLT